jgi:hypothetical protein
VDAASSAPDGKLDTTEDRALASSLTLGTPHLYADWVSTHVHGNAPAGTGPSFTADDLGASQWITVERRNGTPVGFVITGPEGGAPDGTGVSVGGDLPELAAIDAVPVGTVVLLDDTHLGWYSISADLTTATALSPEAQAVVGTAPVDAPTLRGAIARLEAEDATAMEGVTIPSDAVGGGSASSYTRPPSSAAGFAVLGIAAAAGAGALLWLRRRRRGQRS